MDYVLPEKYRLSDEFTALINEKTQAGKIGIIMPGGKGNIPILFAKGQSLPEAWENSIIAVWGHGTLLKTQYDKPEDPPSKDASMIMVIEDPVSEPFIHLSFPGGVEDLEEYRQEVVEGVKNHWIRDPEDPEDTRWEYTYNERMIAYAVPGLEKAINQFEQMAQALAEAPITRRAQIVTWQAWKDNGIDDPACWQSLWGRIMRESSGAELYSDETGQAYLNLNMRFRSRDAYKAAYMNDYAFIHLAKNLAARISEIRGEEVKLGRFVDQSDSYHIYGSYFDEVEDQFLKLLFTRTFEKRTRRLDADFVQDIINEAKPKIKEKIDLQDAKYEKQSR
jgi:thymidylate synthase